jgi:hypothetical protein
MSPPKFRPSSSSGSRKSDDKETATETDTHDSNKTSWCSEEELSDIGSAKQDNKQDDKEDSDDVSTRTSN